MHAPIIFPFFVGPFLQQLVDVARVMLGRALCTTVRFANVTSKDVAVATWEQSNAPVRGHPAEQC